MGCWRGVEERAFIDQVLIHSEYSRTHAGRPKRVFRDMTILRNTYIRVCYQRICHERKYDDDDDDDDDDYDDRVCVYSPSECPGA